MARHVITYTESMSRWAPDARERLRQAAFELFEHQGYAQTTVPEITARAGLTTRTFFRHFTDKREVIFGDDEIPELARRALLSAPSGVTPIIVLVDGLNALAATWFEPRREQMLVARSIIATDPGLRERDLRKRADLLAVLEAGFVERGEPRLDAAVAAALAIDVLHLALDMWLDADTASTPHADLQSCLARVWASVGRFIPPTDRPEASPVDPTVT